MRIPSLVALTCRQVTEIATEYMLDGMDAQDRARFEQHLHACTWCMDYLSQLRDTVALTGQLAEPEPALDPALERAADPAPTDAALLGLFRRWKEQQKP